MRPYSPVSSVAGFVSASVLNNAERVAARSSTVVEGEDSASEALSMVTCCILDSLLDVGPAAVSSSVEPVSSVVIGGSPSATVDALGPIVDGLGVDSLSPGLVDNCLETAATVVVGCVTAAAVPLDGAV